MPSRKRHLTADLLSVLALALKNGCDDKSRGHSSARSHDSRASSRNTRRRQTRSPALPTLPPELLSAILHHPSIPPCCQTSLRLVNKEWRSAFDLVVNRLVCRSFPTQLAARFPDLRHLDLSHVWPRSGHIRAGAVLTDAVPELKYLTRLVLSYELLMGDGPVVLGWDRMELKQVGYRSYPARASEQIARALHSLTQLQDLLVVSGNEDDPGMPSTLAVYHRYGSGIAAAGIEPAHTQARGGSTSAATATATGRETATATGTGRGTGTGAHYTQAGVSSTSVATAASAGTGTGTHHTQASGSTCADTATGADTGTGTGRDRDTDPAQTSSSTPASRPGRAQQRSAGSTAAAAAAAPLPPPSLPAAAAAAAAAVAAAAAAAAPHGSASAADLDDASPSVDTGPSVLIGRGCNRRRAGGRAAGRVAEGGEDATSPPDAQTSLSSCVLTSPDAAHRVKWLSHLKLRLPPFFGPYHVSSIHIHPQDQCQMYTFAEHLLFAPQEELSALPPSAWEQSMGWCSLRVLDLSHLIIASWPPEWLHLPLLQYCNITPYNTFPNDTLPGIGIPPALPLRGLALSAFSATHLLPTLPSLTHLSALSITFAGLTDLPVDLSRISSLHHLSLAGNQLPPSTLDPILPPLQCLQDLDLSQNMMLFTPRSLPELTRLTRLKLMEFGLLEVAEGVLGPLTNLKALDLGANRLTELPPDITCLTALTTLVLQSAYMSSLQPSIGQLTALQSLDLFGNRLLSLPPQIGALTALTTLDLANNFLDRLPAELWELRQLKVLCVASNRLASLAEGITNLENLAHLDISLNPIRLLPPFLSSLPRLECLVAQGLHAPPPLHLVDAPSLSNVDLTEDGLDVRWLESVPTAEFQEVVADPLLALARQPLRGSISVDKQVVLRLRHAWTRAGAEPPFPKLSMVQFDEFDNWGDR